MAYCYVLLLLPTLQLTRAALRRWFTWNCSPPYARITSSLSRLFVAFAGTKHCCLTAVNRDGALCCPDFPRRRGLKPQFFFPYSAIDRYTVSVRCYVRFAQVVSASPKLCALRAGGVLLCKRLCASGGLCLAFAEVVRHLAFLVKSRSSASCSSSSTESFVSSR